MDYDSLCNCLQNVSVGYLEAMAVILSPHICEEERRLAIKSRLNITTFMYKLVPEPSLLLQCMKDNDIVLSGSRAAAFFNPCVATDESDWDFYVCMDSFVHGEMGLRKLSEFFTSMGAVPEDEKLDDTRRYLQDYENLLNDILDVKRLRLNHRGKSHKIQIICHRKKDNFRWILTFDLSIVQCAITGHSAISLYHHYVKDSKTLWWKGIDFRTDIDLADLHLLEEYCSLNSQDFYINTDAMRHDQAMESIVRMLKYRKRGIELVSVDNVTPPNGVVGPAGFTHGRLRHVGDEHCLIVGIGGEIEGVGYQKDIIGRYPCVTWREEKDYNDMPRIYAVCEEEHTPVNVRARVGNMHSTTT